jgi:glycosyltransferase involved in cell wall biosynthesis
MFLINIPQVIYTDPWVSSFEERLKTLAKGQQKVAYYYERPDSSTFRYRVYNMIQVLHESKNNITAAYFTEAELDRLDKVVDVTDVLVICRSRYSDKLNHIITRARNKGKSVFFDIDDLVFNSAFVHLVLDTLDQDLNHPDVWDFWFAYTGRQGATLNLCDGAITTNDYLAKRIRDFTGKQVAVIPNFLNREQMEISERIFLAKKSQKFKRNDLIHLGYFSGTPSHNKDLEVVSDALASILDNDSRIVIRVVGYMDFKGPLQNYRTRIEHYPLQDFINLQRLIGGVEINLVPLQDNEFTNCKSELKYFEAGIVGTVTIASPVFTYSKSIKDGENGYLANSFEWYEKINTLVDNLSTYSVIAEKAYVDSRRKYAEYSQNSLVEKTLFSK